VLVTDLGAGAIASTTDARFSMTLSTTNTFRSSSSSLLLSC